MIQPGTKEEGEVCVSYSYRLTVCFSWNAGGIGFSRLPALPSARQICGKTQPGVGAQAEESLKHAHPGFPRRTALMECYNREKSHCSPLPPPQSCRGGRRKGPMSCPSLFFLQRRWAVLLSLGQHLLTDAFRRHFIIAGFYRHESSFPHPPITASSY